MKKWLLNLIKQYDRWCESLGLTPENRRSCVPYRRDPATTKANTTNKKRSL
ncbi:DUF5363 domain-containing protein [Vibrio neonatus]|uniref:DUF5363 domain-containing protein n=1 Tax=Vibrio neonatus TaxID=278860 RepID=UPI0021C3AB58|nr:DUF5363 domain-containing protein [Vibrio neonatus]